MNHTRDPPPCKHALADTTPLGEAARVGHVNVVDALIGCGAVLYPERAEGCENPAALALHFGHLPIVTLLFEHFGGGEVEVLDRDSIKTALFTAAGTSVASLRSVLAYANGDDINACTEIDSLLTYAIKVAIFV